MEVRQKRYQYWGSVNGKPQIMWTDWFNYSGPEDKIQTCGEGGVVKGHPGVLLQELRCRGIRSDIYADMAHDAEKAEEDIAVAQ